MKPKTPSIISMLDKKYPIIERLQTTPSGWIGKDRLFSKDAVDHAEFIDLSGNSIKEDDHYSWNIIRQVDYVKENTRYWNEAFNKTWDKFGFQIISIIKSNQLTPKQQRRYPPFSERG
jgi:hypothetical protein